jgi:hypothetical protein
MEWLESRAVRPRQARYQAALRPDMHCFTHSKTLSNLTPNPNHHFCLTVHELCTNGLLNNGYAYCRCAQHDVQLCPRKSKSRTSGMAPDT